MKSFPNIQHGFQRQGFFFFAFNIMNLHDISLNCAIIQLQKQG